MSLESKITALFAALFLLGVVQKAAAASRFYDDFENGLGEWQIGDSNPAGFPAFWGIVDFDFGGESARSGENKLYCAATGFSGTAQNPLYAGGMTAFISRTLDLSGFTNATLRFHYKIPSIENFWDTFTVLIGSTEIWSRNTPQPEWTEVVLGLDAYVGGPHALSFQFSSDFSLNHEGCYLDDIEVTDEIAPGPPRTNDNFGSAEILVGARGQVYSNNRHATFESGEPSSGYSATNSLWFSWNSFTNGQVIFSTAGSVFDTVLCIYTGTNLGTALVTAGINTLSFDAVAGVTYRISVRGSHNESGVFQLSWIQPNTEVRELLPDLTLWADETQNYLHGWYLDRSQIAGLTLLRITTATVNIGEGPLELRGSSSIPGVSQRIYRNDGTYREKFAGTFTFHPDHGHLHFDNFINFNLRSVLPEEGVGPIVVAGAKTSSALIDLQIFNASLPGHPAFGQYHGGLVQGLSVGWADVYGANLKDQWIDITGVTPGRYWLEEVVDPANEIHELNESNNVARILIELTPADLAGNATNVVYTNPPPRILNQPEGVNLEAGATLRLAVTAGGWEPLFYQWQHSGTNLVNDNRVLGANTAALSIENLGFTDAGPYTVIVTNLYGSVTSASANLIVLDSLRAIYLEEISAPIGATIMLPINMHALGNENAVYFSLIFDPEALTHPRLLAGDDSTLAILTATTPVDGKIGISIVFPFGTAIPAGPNREIARLSFDVSDDAIAGHIASIGFGDAPLARYVSGTNGIGFYPVFAPGKIQFESVATILRAEPIAEHRALISVSGLSGREYALEGAGNLASGSWTSLATNTAGMNGTTYFIHTFASLTSPQFFRARLLPRSIEQH